MLFLLALLFFGLAGLFSMLGLGGALVYNPLMVWFGYDFKTTVVPTGLLLNGLTALSAAWVYHRNRLMDFSVGLPLTLGATLGAPLGAYLTRSIPTDRLLWLFTLVILGAAFRMLTSRRTAEPERARGTRGQRARVGFLVGLGVGVLAGLLGIGGGFLFVPLLVFLGYPTKVAAATSTLAVVFSSFSGLMGHLSLGHLNPLLMAVASLAVVLGSQVGARVMVNSLDPRLLKRLFGLLLLLIATKLILELLQG